MVRVMVLVRVWIRACCNIVHELLAAKKESDDINSRQGAMAGRL